jgi:cytochrome c oxidase assembly protein subunit 17
MGNNMQVQNGVTASAMATTAATAETAATAATVTTALTAAATTTSEVSDAPKKKKICCACPDTKRIRDECIVEHGEDACKKWIEAHRICLRSEGFNV